MCLFGVSISAQTQYDYYADNAGGIKALNRIIVLIGIVAAISFILYCLSKANFGFKPKGKRKMLEIANTPVDLGVSVKWESCNIGQIPWTILASFMFFRVELLVSMYKVAQLL